MASSKREKELARQRAERQAARRAAAAARRKRRTLVLSSVAAVAVAVAAVVGIYLAVDNGSVPDTVRPAAEASDPAAPSAEPSAAASDAPLAAGQCRYTETTEPASKEVELPPVTGVEQTKQYTVTLATTQGTIAFDMDSAKTPCTSNSLRSLAQAKYFDATPCHRLTTAGISVLQCGDPTGTGTGSPGYQFADEALEGATYPRGTVAMANSGPGTNGSQFFLVYADSQLPAAYTPFGRITQGLDVLDKVAKAGSDGSNGPGDGKPKLPVQVTTLRVTDKPA